MWDAVAGGKPLLKLKTAGEVKAVTWYGEGDARRIVSGGKDGVPCLTPTRAASRC